MKKSNYFILAGIFLVFLFTYMLQQNNQVNYSTAEGFKLLKEENSISSVKKINIFKGNNKYSILLEKNDKDLWIIKTYFDTRADANKIDNFLKSINKIEGELRSSTSSVFNAYGIKDEDAIHVILSGDKEISHFLIGSKTIDNTNGFIRLAGEENVYFVNRNLKSPINSKDSEGEPKNDNWVDLTIIPAHYKFDASSINKINAKLQNFKGEFSKKFEILEPSQTQDPQSEQNKPKVIWKLDNVKKIETSTMDSFIRQLLRIRAEKVIDPSTANDYNLGEYSIEISQPGIETRNLIIGKKDDKYYLKIDNDHQVFEISASNNLISGMDFNLK